jgi:hypothetical protein
VGAFGASTARAASMRRCILRRRWGKATFVEDRELIHCQFPKAWPLHPFRRDVAQREPNGLRGGFVSREMPTGLDDLPQLRMDALERVGGVDQAADLRRKCEERNHVGPRAAPGRHDGRKLPAPGPALECVQRGTRGLGAAAV